MQGDAKKLQAWLSILVGGSESEGTDARERAVVEMQAMGAERLFPLLAPLLSGDDPEARCLACEAALRVDAGRAVELVLPLLADPEAIVRWHACGCLHDFGDERAVSALVRVLQADPVAGVRSTAAYALGGIGSPAAVPALIAALQADHEPDANGHTASSCAATALDDIVGTDETRIREPDGLCTLADGPPDLESLKQRAQARYEAWRTGRK